MTTRSGEVNLPPWVIKKMQKKVLEDMQELATKIEVLEKEPIGDEDLNPRIQAFERVMSFNRFNDFLMMHAGEPLYADSAEKYNEGHATQINIIMFADYLTKVMGPVLDKIKIKYDEDNV